MASNVACGAALGLWTAGQANGAWVGRAMLACAAGICIGIAGNLLNDWADRTWDLQHRPERALPRGIFQPHRYLVLSIAALLLAVSLAAATNRATLQIAAMLIACVGLYTAFHKKTPWAMVAMGMCRAMLPAMGFVAVGATSWRILPAMAVLFCYTVGISLVARRESAAHHKRAWVTGMLTWFPLVDIAVMSPAWLHLPWRMCGGFVMVSAGAILLSRWLRRFAVAT